MPIRNNLPKRKPPIDTEKMERLYRSEQWTVKEIAAQLGCTPMYVYKVAAARGWKRNLSARVRHTVDRVLVERAMMQAMVDGRVGVTEEEVAQAQRVARIAEVVKAKRVARENADDLIVEAAANIGVVVVEKHRADIRRLREIETKLTAELLGEDGSEPTRTLSAGYRGMIVTERAPLTVVEKSTALSNLANVTAKRVALERQAYNLDAPEETRVASDNISLNIHFPENWEEVQQLQPATVITCAATEAEAEGVVNGE